LDIGQIKAEVCLLHDGVILNLESCK